MRERISRELIAKKEFRFIAIEGDWPDAARIDNYVRHLEYPPPEWTAFARFPTWMCSELSRPSRPERRRSCA
jgi:protein-L-isoaspartate(D-aspartate) O-methyltransferase